MPDQNYTGFNEFFRIDMGGAQGSLAEARRIAAQFLTGGPRLAMLDRAVADTVRLFHGSYPGFRAANTAYHDLDHTAAVALAMSRLVHGAILAGEPVEPDDALLGLIAALFHDVGLIQTLEDTQGTGAKYTIGHELRSATFAQAWLEREGYRSERQEHCAYMICCTIVRMDHREESGYPDGVERMGMMLGASDLQAQIADRLYLEKLFLLYREFQEAGLSEFSSEMDLHEKTEPFYRHFVLRRLAEELGGVDRFMRYHFRAEMGQDRDLYEEYARKNMVYLSGILDEYGPDYRNQLRRGGILKRLEREEAA